MDRWPAVNLRLNAHDIVGFRLSVTKSGNRSLQGFDAGFAIAVKAGDDVVGIGVSKAGLSKPENMSADQKTIVNGIVCETCEYCAECE